MGNIAPAEYIEKLFQRGRTNRIRLIKYNKQGDECKFNSGYEEHIYVKPIVSQDLWNKIKGAIKGNKIYEAMQIEEFNEIDYNNMKIELRVGKYKKTININNLDSVSVVEQLGEKVKGIDGHADSKLLLPKFFDCINSYYSNINFTIKE